MYFLNKPEHQINASWTGYGKGNSVTVETKIKSLLSGGRTLTLVVVAACDMIFTSARILELQAKFLLISDRPVSVHRTPLS